MLPGQLAELRHPDAAKAIALAVLSGARLEEPGRRPGDLRVLEGFELLTQRAQGRIHLTRTIHANGETVSRS